MGLRPNWNVGIPLKRDWNNGFGGLTEWVIGKINLTNHKRNEKFGSNPFGRRRIYIPAKDGIYDIPLSHHSIIPCVRKITKPH